jgi:putative NADH-flavin reductase
MKLLIIGGTGKTGRELIKQGLEQGHVITAIIRNPARIKLINPNLNVIRGNVLDYDSLENAFTGQDAILSALGHKRFIIKTSILSDGTDNIIKAMKKHSIKRFICITSLGINDSRFCLGYTTLFSQSR